MKGLFITGIGTDVGKTIVAAVFTKALGACYWKPVQCGDLENSDSVKVERLTGLRALPEAFRLQAPMSPHAAANLENVKLRVEEIQLPKADSSLVVEGAGGIMVPFNSTESYLDLMLKFNLPVVLVTRHYLGSINHTMLSWKVLNNAGLNVVALVISGAPHKSTESYFSTQMDVPIFRVNELKEVDVETIASEAKRLKQQLEQLLR